MGSTTFRGNNAFWGGAIYNTEYDGRWAGDDKPVSITTFPDDTVLDDNDAEVGIGFTPLRSITHQNVCVVYMCHTPSRFAIRRFCPKHDGLFTMPFGIPRNLRTRT